METKTITVKPAGWHRRQHRQKLFIKMRILEKAFLKTDRYTNTTEWRQVQSELGNVYKEVMENYGKHGEINMHR